MRISKKAFWILFFTYSTIVLVLDNVLHTALGEFLMQVGYFALFFVIVSFVYKMTKFSIQQFIYNHRKKNDEKER